MADGRPRSSYERDWLPYTKVTGRSAVRAAIGKALRSRSEVPPQRQDAEAVVLDLVNPVGAAGQLFRLMGETKPRR
jgi:hypothetical protein